MKTSPPGCPDALFARASGLALSPQEEEQLEAHLQRCAACRVAALVATDFEQVSTVLPGDDQLIARIASRIVVPPSTVARRRRTWTVWLVAAALLAFGITAAAALSGRIARSPSTAAAPPSIGPLIRSVAAAASPPGTASNEPVTPEPAPVSPVARLQDHDRRDAVDVTPAALFAEANRLRAAGQVSEAIARYRVLQERFPRSAEATLSHVSTGNLLIGRNDAEAALEQFRAYLSADPSGTLGEEALFGKARALRALGRSAEERETWEALLSAYPGSVYGPVARERDKELR